MPWPLKKLFEVARLYGGSTPARDNAEFWNGDIPWLSPTELPMPGKGIVRVRTTSERITQKGLDACAATLLPPGTVVFSSRATIGKIGITEVPLATNQGFVSFVPSKEILPEFLAYALLVHTGSIVGLAASTTFKEVTRGNIKDVEIPVPTVAEQKRLVSLLNEADALRNLRKKADEITGTVLPAIFHRMFGPAAADYKSWETVTVEQAVDLINGRAFGPDDWGDEGLPIIRIQNLKDPNCEFNYYSGSVDKRHLVSPGDILISWAGQLVSFGVHVWNGPQGALNQHIFRVVPRLDFDPDFLRQALADIVDQARSNFQGSEMKHLTKGTLTQATILYPPLSRQRQFGACVSDLRKLESSQATSCQRLGELFQSALQRGFLGEL
jgi:type I restriction enzyme S subunit